MARRRMMEPPILEDGDMDGMWSGMDELDQLISQRQAMDLGMAALAGGGGALLASTVIPKLPSNMITDTPTKRGLLSIFAGFVGGRLLWNTNRDAAIGVAAGMAGLGLATVVGELMKVSIGLDQYNEDDMFEEELSAMPTVTEDRMPRLLDQAEDDDLLGLNAVVEEEQFADAVVEEERLGSFLS